MFGFFKKKNEVPSQAKWPVSESRAKAVFKQFEEFAEGEIDPLEGALTMFQLNQERYLEPVIVALAKAEVELLLCENDPSTAPLMLQSDDGFAMMPIFSQRRRSEKCRSQFPEYQFFLRAPFTVILERLKPGAGLVINPFEEVVTWTMPPEIVEHLKDALGIPKDPDLSVEKLTERESPPAAKYLPGQVWKISGLESGFEAELTVLYVETKEQTGTIVHIAVSGLNLPNGGTTISHMPFTEDALDRSGIVLCRSFGPVPSFFEGYKQWSEANGGVFSVTVAEGVECIRTALSAQL
ncbi:SseB family protein [Prosthecobacter sp.]|uniref:SseB family protein n=1 Tax=Prosthecobacter sp. TaxID=1965333 RepID=UPI003784B2A9